MTISNSIVIADNAYGTIGVGLAVGDTALTFTTGHGARFPAVATGQVLYCCLLNSTNVLEEVQITAHTAGSDSATIVRAQGATTAQVWSAGDRIEARISTSVLKRLQDEALKKTALTTSDGGATYTASLANTALGYVTGLFYLLTVVTTNSGANPTINLDGLGAVTVKLDGGVALVAGSMPLNGLYTYNGTNLILLNPAITGPLTVGGLLTASAGFVEKRKQLTGSGPLAIDASLGNYWVLQATGSAITISNPTGMQDGQALDISIYNATVGAITTTFGSDFAVSGGVWTDPATARTRSIRFRYDGNLSRWMEISRSTADAS